MNEILFGIHYDEDDKDWIKIQKLREAGIKGEFHKNSKKMFFMITGTVHILRNQYFDLFGPHPPTL